ncbi:RNA-directed DNA polymerase, eukaryota [Tanacetum coccineum]|uniref:RNA-directed DNA polymerase, eukaryota n=1 Tax=Tanacetum coccineum TaxID=301880 RepID=A0ABQ4WVF5_9ASTR
MIWCGGAIKLTGWARLDYGVGDTIGWVWGILGEGVDVGWGVGSRGSGSVGYDRRSDEVSGNVFGYVVSLVYVDVLGDICLPTAGLSLRWRAIRGIFDNGDWCTDPSLVKEAFRGHFASRFTQPSSSRFKINFTFPNRLSADQIGKLDKDVTPDEIRMAVWECGECKSPGPDGYTLRYWSFIGPDFCSVVSCFFDKGCFPRAGNSSFIALIPKVLDAKFVTDFRPISLIGNVYKVVTKILASRLALVILDPVSNTQSAFIANRQILDGPFILNEVLAWCKKKRKQALIFKVDFAKAYDSVRSNMASILVNGSPTNEFPICCGLKQGDPLAPFLFILVMESLHLSISRAITDGFFNGLHINASMSLSHLFYADDAVFLGEWSDENLDNLLKILRCFHLASGLRINIAKSNVLGVGVPLEIVHQGASRIGCEVMKTPFKYLGIMVGDHMSRCSAWSNSIQKVRTRLSKWKVKTLSIGGRLTLLKSVLGAVPIYNLSIYKAPKRVLHDMEMLRSKYFNGGDSQDSRILWVAWERVLSSKKNGGLGVSSFFTLNRALLLKWLWRFLSQDNSLWSYVIRAIHGPRLELHSYSTQFVWAIILREVQLLASEGFDFLSRCKISVGDGIKVAAKFGEASQWFELLSLTGSVSLSSSSDRWICDCNGEGVFHVKDIRSALDDHFLPSADVAIRWVKFVPIKTVSRLVIGILGSVLSGCRSSSRPFWKAFSILHGGIYGHSETV